MKDQPRKVKLVNLISAQLAADEAYENHKLLAVSSTLFAKALYATSQSETSLELMIQACDAAKVVKQLEEGLGFGR